MKKINGRVWVLPETATDKTTRQFQMIRLAINEARYSIDHFRATGETRRYSSPLPQRHWVRLYNRAYLRTLSRDA